MNDNARVKFGISVDRYPRDMWSFGITLSHDYEETYLWINLIKWTIAIGMMRA